MQDDFNIFWQNNDCALALFDDLAARMERGAYDDEYLARLGAYQEERPDTAHFYIFAARYLAGHGRFNAALLLAERAYRLRPVNYEVWKLLAEIYRHLGRYLAAVTMEGYGYSLYEGHKPQLELPSPEMLPEALNRLAVALGPGNYAPLAPHRPFYHDGELTFRRDVFVGETLPLTMPQGSDRFYVGCYAEKCFLSEKGALIEQYRHDNLFALYGHHDFVFDFQKAHEAINTVHIEVPEGREIILPIAGTHSLQECRIETGSDAEDILLGKWAFSNYRLSESATLTASETFAVGTPIHLGHDPHRKKLVLNILVDGLSWAAARTRFPACMPRIAEFFSRGVIFDQTFSTSEHTHPALPAIETGRYPQRIHIFNEKDSHELPLDIPTLSEQMKSLGYYCAAPMASGFGIYNGVMRGYDRIVSASWKGASYEGVDRTIRQIEALEEVEQFLLLHVRDVHPWDGKDFKFDPTVEARLSLKERRLTPGKGRTASVRLLPTKVYQEEFWASLRNVDRTIGSLLAYIADRYDEDEYIVNLYSDHGLPCFGAADVCTRFDLAREVQTSAIWMMRGAGVPACGIVDELTSIVDIYPTLGHLCGFPVPEDVDGNLPAVFGGRERDVVYSALTFPGQTFKLAVRSKTHAFRLETQDTADEDGTVDFRIARTGIYPRGHEWEDGYEADSAELRAFFYPRARAFVEGFASNGELFPSMKKT